LGREEKKYKMNNSRRVKREIDEQMEAQEPYAESSDDVMQNDLRQNLNLPSNVMPEDYYQYKRFVNLPESQAEFETKIDKDVVFSNLSGNKPSIEELRFQVGTIELFESEFVEEIRIPRINPETGKFLRDLNGHVIYDLEYRFDETFRGCLNFLKAEYKFSVVASRAIGSDRAAQLDITSANRISKEFQKKREDKQKLFGGGV
jgi:hypothetical protein